MDKVKESINQSVLAIKLSKNPEQKDFVVSDGHRLISDLGFTSLDLAQLIADLEAKLNVDPFSQGVHLSQVSTVSDLHKVYESSAMSNN